MFNVLKQKRSQPVHLSPSSNTLSSLKPSYWVSIDTQLYKL